MIRTSIRKSGLLAIGCLLFLVSTIAHGADYDPLAVPAQVTPRIVDLTVKDLERRRDIPIRIYLPQAMQVAPVVLSVTGLADLVKEVATLASTGLSEAT